MGFLFSFVAFWLFFVIILPFIIKWLGGDEEAIIVQMKEVNNGRALYVFPGMCSPSAEAGFRQFAEAYDGDVWFVQYAHSGCAMDVYCQQVYLHACSKWYSHVDVLGVSIGAQTYATLYRYFKDYDQYGHFTHDNNHEPVLCRSGIDYDFWAICPFSPATANYDVLDKAKMAVPFAVVVRVALGIIGQLPFIRWDGVWRSPREIIEQGYLAVKGKPLVRYVDLIDKARDIWVYPEDGRSLDARREIRGIVMAKKDALADNQRIETFYQTAPLAYANGDHCDFKEHGDDYVTALRNLGLFI